MQISASINDWRHTHAFDEGNPLAERNARWAVALTTVMMIAEIAGGWAYNSMAVLADGWHMSSHALALGLSVLAYGTARRFARDERFAFGTWKIEALGGYTSAVFLAGVAGLMLYQSFERLISPTPIQYNQAIAIAISGLLVNLACAQMLKDDRELHHDRHHRDMNLRSAYLHVLADASTSALAILALIGGKFWGADWLDPAMGIAGAVLVAVWAYGLLRDTGRVLLDAEMDAPVVAKIRKAIDARSEKIDITDLHVWRVGKSKYACILSLAVTDAAVPDEFRRLLSIHDELAHVTVEVNQRQGLQST
ncbi:MAG: CDF family Co(II)/Ni(II) efflux transporter DmeF [Candidatus Omnitrophota bacterium]